MKKKRKHTTGDDPIYRTPYIMLGRDKWTISSEEGSEEGSCLSLVRYLGVDGNAVDKLNDTEIAGMSADFGSLFCQVLSLYIRYCERYRNEETDLSGKHVLQSNEILTYISQLKDASPDIRRASLKGFIFGGAYEYLCALCSPTVSTGMAVYDGKEESAKVRKSNGTYYKRRTKQDGMIVIATPANTMSFYLKCLKSGDSLKVAMRKTCDEFNIRSEHTVYNHLREVKETDPALADAVEKAKAALK